MSDELASRVVTWLSTSGYRVEFAVAHAFRSKGWWTSQGMHHVLSAGAPREIDVVAGQSLDDETGSIKIVHVVECKYSKHPWVVLASDSQLPGHLSISQTIANETGHAAMWIREFDIGMIDAFETRGPIGFSVKTAFADTRDSAYAALQGVIAACVGLQREYPVNTFLGELARIEIFLPIVVVDAPLFVAVHDEQNGGLKAQRVSSARVQWWGAEAHAGVANVDIVELSGLTEFVSRRTDDCKMLFLYLKQSRDELARHLAEASLASLIKQYDREGPIPNLLRRAIRSEEQSKLAK